MDSLQPCQIMQWMCPLVRGILLQKKKKEGKKMYEKKDINSIYCDNLLAKINF